MTAIALLGGHLCGAMLPATRSTDAGDVIEVLDKAKPDWVHVWERKPGETVAFYVGCFAQEILIEPPSEANSD